ncbi:MAG: peroxiredoxin [Azovibrio sp.]
MSAPQLNEQVKDFTLSSTSDQIFTLSAHRGKTVVIYFYPKDNTPGCTTEAQEFRNLHSEFVAANAVVVGVSRDTLKSHESFRCDQELPFELLSDPDETLCAQFDVIKTKQMYGKTVQGIDRSSFVIDAKGVLRREWRTVKVPGHAQEVLDFVKTL